MSKSTYLLETKTTNSGVRGEIVNTVEADSLSEAIQIFALIKQLREDQLLELFSVYERNTNGKRTTKKRS